MNTHLWEPIIDADAVQADPRHWLESHMSANMPWLLIHADDGVLWGRRSSQGALALSSDAFNEKSRFPSIAVELRAETMQQVRIFGTAGELLLWREGTTLRGRSITDDEGVSKYSWDEQHLLWGTQSEQVEEFTLLVEGRQGPRHAVPISVPSRRHAALTIRHYIGRDKEGQAAVVLSRLVDLGLYEPRKGGIL